MMLSKLAIDGGARVISNGAVKRWPVLNDADRAAVLKVFDNEAEFGNALHTNSAPFAQQLQDQWAEFCGAKHCIVTNGGTSALHMALAASGVQPGDQVLTSAYSYWATAASILHQNAVPVFVDSDPDTATMDPAAIEERITEYTTAILPVHIHGMPADMDPILEVAEKHGLIVVTDCCQAHGAGYRGRKVGSIANASGFSLNRSKNLTGGEGGLVTTNDERIYRRAGAMTRFGIVEEEGFPGFSGLGFNYRPHEFTNALICSQLERLPANNAGRREMARHLSARLNDIPGVEGPPEPEYADPCYWNYMYRVRPEQLGLDVEPRVLRAGLCRALAAEGIPTGPVQAQPVPGEEIFQRKVGFGNGCPWCGPAGDVEYNVDEYPATQEICANRAFIGGVHPPNDLSLMQLYLDGFTKALEQPDRLIELAAEA